MKTVLLHIGLPKTATTLIQDCLASDPPALRNAGVHYVRSGTDVFGDNGHHVLVQALLGYERGRYIRFGTEEKTLQDAWPSALREMRRHPAPIQVLSSELFSFTLTEMRDLRVLHRKLNGFKVRVVLVLRDVGSFVDSVYAQRVKDGSGNAPGEFAAETWDLLNWRDMTHRWARVFGRENVRVLDFDALQDGNQLVDSFLRKAADVTADGPFFAPQTTNVALPYNAQQIIREVNASDIAQPQQIQFRHMVRAFFDEHGHAAGPTAFRKAKFLSEDAKEVLRRHCDWPHLDG